MKKETLHISLQCDTCGSDSHFISNEDNSNLKSFLTSNAIVNCFEVWHKICIG